MGVLHSSSLADSMVALAAMAVSPQILGPGLYTTLLFHVGRHAGAEGAGVRVLTTCLAIDGETTFRWLLPRAGGEAGAATTTDTPRTTVSVGGRS